MYISDESRIVLSHFLASLTVDDRQSPAGRLMLDIRGNREREEPVTIGDLLLQLTEGHECGARIGPKTMIALENRIEIAESCRGIDGAVNWDEFAFRCGAVVLPARDVTSGSEFLAAIPDVIAGLVATESHPVDRLILQERLSKPAHERMTLEEIGAQNRMTRERVRQRQEKQLDSISNALLYADYDQPSAYFRSNFSRFWQVAARQFGSSDHISFADFITTLQSCWSVSAEEIIPRLPLITSVLTRQAVIPHELRPDPTINLRIFGVVSRGLLETPIERFPLGSSVADIKGRGIDTFGDLVLAAQQRRMPDTASYGGRLCSRLLNSVASALDQAGNIDWAIYAREMGLLVLPAAERPVLLDFLDHVVPDLEEIVAANRTSGRAAEIFRLRTSQPAQARPTLSEVAMRLQTHGPSVKREETLLLAALHTNLVDRNFTETPVLFRPSFLDAWQRMNAIFQNTGDDFDAFRGAVAKDCGVERAAIEPGSHAIWAVLTQYPHGRKSRGVGPRSGESVVSATDRQPVVVLRGFRRLH